MSFLRLLLTWPSRYILVLLGFSSGDLEVVACMCCSFLEVAESNISSCSAGETDFKFEQNNGSGARGRLLLFTGVGEITCSHLGALLICSEHLFT